MAALISPGESPVHLWYVVDCCVLLSFGDSMLTYLRVLSTPCAVGCLQRSNNSSVVALMWNELVTSNATCEERRRPCICQRTSTCAAPLDRALLSTRGSRPSAAFVDIYRLLLLVRFFQQMYWYEEAVQVTSVHPLFVPSTGGTRVTIQGSGFPRRGDVQCRFGEDEEWIVPTTSYAYVFSPGKLSCIAPSIRVRFEGLRTVQVFLATTGTFEPTGFWVTYAQQMEISSYNPTRFYEGGGDGITIFGQYIPDLPDLACRFSGGALVPAMWLRSTAARCVTPMLSPGSALIEVTFNGEDFVSAPDMLQVQAKLTITGIYPPSGSINGGTAVTVTGTGFDFEHLTGGGGEGFACLFGKTFAPANISSPGRIHCQTPARLANTDDERTGFVPVTVMRRSYRRKLGEVLTAPSSVLFLYTREAILTAVHPTSGATAGGTRVNVTAIRKEIAYMQAVGVAPELRCRFGSVDAPLVHASDPNVRGEAGESIFCIAPAFLGAAPAVVPVEISLNGGADFVVSVADFLYFETSTVVEVRPASVTVQGGSTVTLSGRDFPFTTDVACVFGHDSAAVQATWVSSSALECNSPSHSPGFIFVSATFNGVDIVTSTALLEYAVELSISSIWPAYTAASSGPVITIHGMGFINSSLLSLRWALSPEGGTSQTAWHLIDLKFVNDSAATFRAPRIPVDDEMEMVVLALEVSNNGLDFAPVHADVRLVIAGAPRVSSAFPRFGSSLGATLVSLGGRGFVPGATWCRFGLRHFNDTAGAILGSSLPLVVARVTNSTHLACLTPEAVPGDYFIQVLTGAGTDDMATAAESFLLPPDPLATAGFTFISAYRPTVVEPKVLPESGGVMITIDGVNLSHTGMEACRFGGIEVVAATWRSPSEVRCKSPPRNPGSVGVELTLNGAEWLSVPSGLRYETDRFVHSMSPTSGPQIGGTTVRVIGVGFAEPQGDETGGMFFCSFGQLEVRYCWTRSNKSAPSSQGASIDSLTADFVVSIP